MSAADAARAAAENTRIANIVRSTQDGQLDASRLLFAIAQGGDARQLQYEAIERITALHDADRLAAFHRALAKALRT